MDTINKIYEIDTEYKKLRDALIEKHEQRLSLLEKEHTQEIGKIVLKKQEITKASKAQKSVEDIDVNQIKDELTKTAHKNKKVFEKEVISLLDN